jgi:hypothetical protein
MRWRGDFSRWIAAKHFCRVPCHNVIMPRKRDLGAPRVVHRTARCGLRLTRLQRERAFGLLRSAGDVWCAVLELSQWRRRRQDPPLAGYRELAASGPGTFGELDSAGARSVLRRYSDAWFATAKRRAEGKTRPATPAAPPRPSTRPPATSSPGPSSARSARSRSGTRAASRTCKPAASTTSGPGTGASAASSPSWPTRPRPSGSPCASSTSGAPPPPAPPAPGGSPSPPEGTSPARTAGTKATATYELVH